MKETRAVKIVGTMYSLSWRHLGEAEKVAKNGEIPVSKGENL